MFMRRTRVIRRGRARLREEQNVALFVDGPNMLRKEFMIDLRELKKRAEKFGRVIIAKVFINQFAPEKLIEAIINEGYETVMLLAEKEEEANDVDVALAVSAIETILTKDIDVVALATRDADFLPVVQKAKEYGKLTVIFGAEPGFSSGLRNAADFVELL
jgi:uncharacterized protein (TIGR00288 family)